MEFWGIEVKPGQVVKCEPGDERFLHLSQAALGENKKDKGNENVPIFVKFNDQKLVIGTLSSGNCAQIQFDIVFEKEFELSHGSKNESVFFVGYKRIFDGSVADATSDDDLYDSDDEAFGNEKEEIEALLKKNNQLKPGTGKSAAATKDDSVTANKAKPQDGKQGKGEKTKLIEDNKNEVKEQVEDDDESDEDSDSDSDDEESDEEEDDDDEDESKNGKKRSAAGGLKFSNGKKAKFANPAANLKSGGNSKKAGQANIPPAKKAGKTPVGGKAKRTGAK